MSVLLLRTIAFRFDVCCNRRFDTRQTENLTATRRYFSRDIHIARYFCNLNFKRKSFTTGACSFPYNTPSILSQVSKALIEYTDQDPRIHRMYLDALAKNGVKSRMGEFLDEDMLLAEKA